MRRDPETLADRFTRLEGRALSLPEAEQLEFSRTLRVLHLDELEQPAKRGSSEMNMRELLDELERKDALLDQAAAISRREIERQERELARVQSRLAEHREREEAQGLKYRIEAKKDADGKPVLDKDGFPVMTRLPWAGARP
jgi:vacuolar-type H+-ATPase subunit I/STV1